MRDHLGIGLRGKAVPAPLEIRAQLLMILDDAVVNDGEPVARDMRMSISLTRHTMRGPARVCDAKVARRRRLLEGLLEHLHFADGAQALEVLCSVQDRDAGRV